jgi:hypothetical protein
MRAADRGILIYRALADEAERRGLALLRDRFLVLAADAALTAGRAQAAEQLRTRLLRHNPGHLVGTFPSFARAMESALVRNFVAALRRKCNPAKAEQMLRPLRRVKGRVPPREDTRVPQAAAERKPPRIRRRQPVARAAAVVRKNPPATDRAIPAVAAPPPVATPAGANAGRTAHRAEPAAMHAPAAPVPRLRGKRWLCDTLFWLGLAAGVLVAGYSLLRPFVAFP